MAMTKDWYEMYETAHEEILRVLEILNIADERDITIREATAIYEQRTK